MADTVKVVVGLVSAAVTTGLKKLKHEFHEFRKDANKEFSVGEFLAAGALIEGFHKIIEEVELLVNTAHRFGVLTSSLQRISNAAKEDGVSIEQVGQAMNKLVINQEKVKQGDEKMRHALKDLNIDQEEYINMGAEEAFYKIADAVKDAKDDTTAYAAVVELLGKSAGSLIPTLRKGSEEIKKLGDAAGVMSDETAEELKEAADVWDRTMNKIKVAVAETFGWIAKAAKEVGLVIGTVGAMFTGTSDKDAGAAYAEGHKEIWDKKEEHEEKHRPHRDLEETEKDLEERKKAAAELLKYAEETDKINEKIDKQNLESELATLDVAGKIARLENERYEEMIRMDEEADHNKRLESIVKINEIEKQINDERTKGAKEEEQRQEKIARLRETVEKKQFEADQDGLTDAQKLVGLEMRRDEIKHKADTEDDEEKKLQLMSEYLDTVKEIDGIANKKKDNDKLAVDALTKIGGNANTGVGYIPRDPTAERAAKAAEKTTKVLDESKKLLKSIETKISDSRWR